MWVETIDGFIVNSDVLEKIEIELYRTATVKSKSEPIRLNIDHLSPEAKEKLKEELNTLMEHTKSIRCSEDEKDSEDEEIFEDEVDSEDEEVPENIYEIRAWSANDSKDPYILFRGGKNDCDSKFTEFKSKLGYIHAW